MDRLQDAFLKHLSWGTFDCGASSGAVAASGIVATFEACAISKKEARS